MKKALLVLALSVAVGAKPDPYLIVPGKGFGPFGPSMTLAELEKKMEPGDYLEGESLGHPSAEIYAMDPFVRITLLLNHQRQIRSMFVSGYMGKWHTAEGIRLGTTLVTLERLNGRAFRFHSLSEKPDACQVFDWQGGRLARALPKVRITFASAMHSEGYGGLSATERRQVERGGAVLTSSDPVVRRLNPIVEFIELLFRDGREL